jgi:hypothetical protein
MLDKSSPFWFWFNVVGSAVGIVEFGRKTMNVSSWWANGWHVGFVISILWLAVFLLKRHLDWLNKRFSDLKKQIEKEKDDRGKALESAYRTMQEQRKNQS